MAARLQSSSSGRAQSQRLREGVYGRSGDAPDSMGQRGNEESEIVGLAHFQPPV